MTSEERIEAMQGKPTCCVLPGDAALLCALTASAVMYPDTDPCGCPCHKTHEELLKELAEARTERDKWKTLAKDAYEFLGPRENATGEIDDDLRNLLQGHMHCSRIEKELHEARERATAAEEQLLLSEIHRDGAENTLKLEITAASKLEEQRDQLCAALEQISGWPGIEDAITTRAMKRIAREAIDAAMGVAEEPTGGKPE